MVDIQSTKRANRIQDITGKTFHMLTVVRCVGVDSRSGESLWQCICKCGTTKVVRAYSLKSGMTRSCGCLKKLAPQLQIENLAGRTFGKLTVQSLVERKTRKTMWLCLCSCGGNKIVNAASLKCGGTRSCGCMRRGWEKWKKKTATSPRTTTRTWYIYVLRCPDTKRVRYVGWTFTPKGRLRVHCYRARKFGRTYCERWIATLLRQNKIPEMEIIQTSTGPWEESETRWIAHFRALGEPLTNLTPGGEGSVGYVPTQETIDKISRANKGKKCPEAQKQLMRKLMKGRVFTPEWKEKIRLAKLKNNPARGVKLTPEMKSRIGSGVKAHHARRRAASATPLLFG